MATQSKKSKSSTAKPKAGVNHSAKAASSQRNQAQSVAQTVVDLPVGAVLGVTDRIGELVEPFTARPSAQRKLKSYRSELRRSIKRTERRGATARRKAATEARRTRTRVEREARKRQREVESTLKRNRNDVEQRIRRTIDDQATRAQDLVDQVTEQLSSLR